MANLKNITELPVAESADGLNLIVNDNGSAKQIATNKISSCVVTFSMDSEGNWTADKTFNEVKEAVESGIVVYGRQGNDIYTLFSTGGGEGFGFVHLDLNTTSYHTFWLWEGDSVSWYNNRDMHLPLLIFTGAVEANYNGTESVTVNIPTEEWDLDLTVDITWNTETSAHNDPVFTAAEGYSYDAFIAKLEAGEIPNVKVKVNLATSETSAVCEFVKQPSIGYENGTCVLLWFGALEVAPEIVMLNADGTFAFNIMN